MKESGIKQRDHNTKRIVCSSTTSLFIVGGSHRCVHLSLKVRLSILTISAYGSMWMGWSSLYDIGGCHDWISNWKMENLASCSTWPLIIC
jgi:hypothetical protein